MMRIDLRSLRFGIGHQFREAVEEVTDVMRSGARLRMPLEAERGPIGAREALEGTVEERYMRRPQIRAQRRWIDREAVVLAGDDDLAAVEILQRVVGAVVAELHLQSLRARGEAHQLVAEADAEDGQTRRVEDLADRFDRIVARLRVAGPVGEKNAVGLE